MYDFFLFSTLCIYYHGEIEDERELVVEEGMISMISIRGWNMLEKHGLEDGMNGIFFVKQTWDEKVLLRETYETNSVMFHHGK